MKSRFVVASLAFLLASSSAGAQSLAGLAARPLEAGITAAAAQTTPSVRTERRNAEMYWGGLMLSGLGGFTLGYALTMQHDVTCVNFGAFVTCQETGANRGALIGIGAVAIGAGWALSGYGGKRVAVAPTRNGIVGTLRF